MKKQLLLLGALCIAYAPLSAQVTMSKTLPPVGTEYQMLRVTSLSGLSKAQTGADKVWDFSSITTTPLAGYKILALSGVKQSLRDSFPSTSYVEMLNIGAPDINLNPMDFYEDKGDHLHLIGQKGSGSNAERKGDTLIVFNQSYGSTLNYRGMFINYAGYGTLKVKTKTYDSVAMLVYTKSTNTDTVVWFYQFKPHYQKLFGYNVLSDTIAAAYYYEPIASTPTGLEDNTLSNVSVYPNPASESIYVEIPEQIDLISVRVVDVSGKTVITTKEVNKNNSIDIGHLSQGMYWIQIQAGDAVVTKKFIKH